MLSCLGEQIEVEVNLHAIVEQFREGQSHGHYLLYKCNQHPVVARLDPKLMKEAITNLLSNAVKYSPSGTTITVDLSLHSDHINLFISDPGIGIPVADQAHLFEPFYRAGNVSAIPDKGLGLSITKQSIEMQGGTISVISTPGVGTSFTITIGLCRDERK